MSCDRVPDIFADGRWMSGDALDGMARAWRAAMLDAIGDRHRVIATALPATPEGVALFAALTSLPMPIALLSPDPTAWPRAALPPGTCMVLLPSQLHLAGIAEEYGYVPYALPNPATRTNAPSLSLLSGPGVIIFTSGSTGNPKPVFRAMPALLQAAATRAEALGLQSGDGIIVGVTIVHGQGMNMLLSSMLLGGPLGFLPPINHRAALATLAMPEFKCWRATPHFADVLGRCALSGPAVAPRVCLLSSPISNGVFDAFLQRFGVPLRQGYASGETGPIAVDNRPASEVRPGTVGRLLPRVEVHVGEHPGTQAPAGVAGRIWIRSPYQMAGYGIPPDLERPGVVDDWWPTRDLGSVQSDGQMVLAGRIDDCIRTRDGRLVNLAAITEILCELRSVRGIAVVPLAGDMGSSFGAVVECASTAAASTLRIEMSDALPAWARPRKVIVVPALPKLPNGKPDRNACRAILGQSS